MGFALYLETEEDEKILLYNEEGLVIGNAITAFIIQATGSYCNNKIENKSKVMINIDKKVSFKLCSLIQFLENAEKSLVYSQDLKEVVDKLILALSQISGLQSETIDMLNVIKEFNILSRKLKEILEERNIRLKLKII